MSAEPEFFVECTTAEEVGRAFARGLAVMATPAAAAACGAEPGDPDEFEDVLESHLHPHGNPAAEEPD